MLRIGIIGVVSELPKLCSSIAEMEEIQFIGFHCINDENFANNFARFSSLNELLLATDAVYISSKSANHEDVIERSIKNQIHTLVEFPFIIDTGRGNELMNLAHEANIKLQVGNPLKFTPVYLGIKDKFDSPMFIESHQLQSINSELTNTSVIQNLMIKDIDVILSIVQSSVKKISANGVAVVNGTPDITNARIEFDNGCVANLTASRISLNPMHKMRFFQRNSYINVDFQENIAHLFQMKSGDDKGKGAMTLKLADGVEKEVFYQKPDLAKSNPIQEEVKMFVESIVNNLDNDLTIPKALNSIEIAQLVAEKVKLAAMIIE
jgi:predicted dehydrogenase|tara:strand:+ start:1016 stop:1981 length:966 start_codon:yes stop_codon:yes gene_type:complete